MGHTPFQRGQRLLIWHSDNTTNLQLHSRQFRMPEMEKPGGMSYEVVLEGPKKTEQPTVKCPSTPTPTVKDIEKKLKEAEERRKSMEASTLEKLAEKEKRAEEVRAKKATMPTKEDAEHQ